MVLTSAHQCPSTNGQFARFRRQAQIIILEILQCIPAVIIFVFLELEQIFLIRGRTLTKSDIEAQPIWKRS